MDFASLVRRLRLLPRRERLRVADLGGVAHNTAQNIALGYVTNPTLQTIEGLRAGLKRYESARARGRRAGRVHAE